MRGRDERHVHREAYDQHAQCKYQMRKNAPTRLAFNHQ